METVLKCDLSIRIHLERGCADLMHTCYQCLREFNPSDVYFRCDPDYLRKTTQLSNILAGIFPPQVDIAYSEYYKNKRSIRGDVSSTIVLSKEDLEKKITMLLSNSSTEQFSLREDKSSLKKTIQSSWNYDLEFTPACPHCHCFLYDGFLNFNSKNILILGLIAGIGAGKTCLLSSIVGENSLNKYAADLTIQSMDNPESMYVGLGNIYRENWEKIKRGSFPTGSEAQFIPPELFKIKDSKNDEEYLLVIYDSSGEIQDQFNMNRTTDDMPFLKKLDGILALIDPTNIWNKQGELPPLPPWEEGSISLNRDYFGYFEEYLKDERSVTLEHLKSIVRSTDLAERIAKMTIAVTIVQFDKLLQKNEQISKLFDEVLEEMNLTSFKRFLKTRNFTRWSDEKLIYEDIIRQIFKSSKWNLYEYVEQAEFFANKFYHAIASFDENDLESGPIRIELPILDIFYAWRERIEKSEEMHEDEPEIKGLNVNIEKVKERKNNPEFIINPSQIHKKNTISSTKDERPLWKAKTFESIPGENRNNLVSEDLESIKDPKRNNSRKWGRKR